MMNRNLFLLVPVLLAFAVALAYAGTEAAPSNSNILARRNLAQPTQASVNVYKGGVAVAKSLNTPTVGIVKISTLYGSSLPAGTNKIVFRCAAQCVYGGSTTTFNPAANMTIASATDTIFRGTTAELEDMYIGLATDAAATYSAYIFPFSE